MTDDRVVPIQPQRHGQGKSTVIAEFVDEIPEIVIPKVIDMHKTRTTWAAQAGIREAFSKAFNNPGKNMILVHYDVGAMSVRKKNAKLRVMSFEKQGYTEDNGWIIRAVEDKIYCSYVGAR